MSPLTGRQSSPDADPGVDVAGVVRPREGSDPWPGQSPRPVTTATVTDAAGVQASPAADPFRRLPAQDGHDSLGLAGLLWRPLPSGSSLEWTVQRLTQTVRFGVIAPGQRLPSEREMAERLHVGRETVREAIRALRAAGLVRTERGRTGGTFVATVEAPPPADQPLQPGLLADLLVYRMVLETGAAALAAGRSLEPDIRRLLVDSLEASLRRPRPSSFAHDIRLHLTLAAASGSPLLLGALADVHFQLDPPTCRLPRTARDQELDDEQHQRIVDAVLTGDRFEAQRQMAQHCQATEARLLRPDG